MSDLGDDIKRYVDDKFPKGVSVPTGVSEDEAIRSVQEQFRQAGLDAQRRRREGLCTKPGVEPGSSAIGTRAHPFIG